jgi:hypothetical protein
MPQTARQVAFDPAKYKPRSWVSKHRAAIGLSLAFSGLALLIYLRYFHLQGDFATILRYVAAGAIILSFGFRRYPFFRQSRVNEENKGKFLVLLAFLWLVMLPTAYLLMLHALRK